MPEYEQESPERTEADSTLEVASAEVEHFVQSLRFVVHGNSSEADIQSIQQHGLRVTEGRSTVSANIVHATDWSSNLERRAEYSQASTSVDHANGGIAIIDIPKGVYIDFGTFTGLVVDDVEKTISGDPLKYASGAKQLAVYSQPDTENRRQELESIKLAERPSILIPPEQIRTVTPTEQFRQSLIEVEEQVKQFEPVSIDVVTKELVEQGVPTEAAQEIAFSTIVSIVVSRIRNIALRVWKDQGFTITNRGSEIHLSMAGEVDVQAKLQLYQERLARNPYPSELSWLQTYALQNIERLRTKSDK